MTTDPRNIAVEDQLALYRLASLYSHIVDDAAWGRLGEIFSRDAVVDFSPFLRRHFRHEGIDSIHDCFATMRHPIAHHVTNFLIADYAGDMAVLRVKFLIIEHDGRPLTGEYRDVVRREAAGWRFTERRAVPPLQIESRWAASTRSKLT